MNNYIKKFVAVACVLSVATSVVACGCSDNNVTNTGASAIGTDTDDTNTTAETKVISNGDDGKVSDVANKLDAKSIYNTVTYVPQMFYGCYAMEGGYRFPVSSQAISDYLDTMDYWTADNVCSSYNEELTKVPFRIDAGPCTLTTKIASVKDHYWMCMYFQSKKGYVESVTGAYTVSGNKLTFTPLKSLDDSGDVVNYELSDKPIEYQFSFSGPNIVISMGDKSAVLTARGMSSTYNNVIVNNYKTDSSSSIANIERFDIYYSKDEYDESNVTQHFNLMLSNNEAINNAVCEFSKDGLFTFSWKDKDGKDKAYQYVYFYGENDGLVLTDGKTTYFYNDSYSTRNKDILGNSINSADKKKLGEMDEEQIAIIVTKRKNLLDELQTSLEKAGINFQIDKESGEIMLDSTVLFGYDESELSGDGKKFLNKFLKAYTSVILQDEYKNFVSKVMVEGHTDSSGSKDYNKKLSKSRADNVKDYCLSSSSGLDDKTIKSLKKLLESVGKANEEPVLGKDGKEDETASRRVSFKFIINLDNAEK